MVDYGILPAWGVMCYMVCYLLKIWPILNYEAFLTPKDVK